MPEQAQANGQSATERLDAATAFWRSRLSEPPLERCFTADPNLPVFERPLDGPRATSSPIFEVHRLSTVVEVPDADRRARLAATHRPPENTLEVRQGSTRRWFLCPITYRLRTPLSAEDEETLRRQQVAELAYFDASLAQTRETLLRLVERGADPVRILSLLLQYARLEGAAFPMALTVQRDAYDFVAVIPHRRRELPLAPLLRRDVPVRLETRTTVTPPPRERRPGPAETGVNAGMALLARHLKRHAKRPHLAEIGALFPAWGQQPSELERKAVWRRIARLQERHAKELRRLVLQDDQRAQAERLAFELFTR